MNNNQSILKNLLYFAVFTTFMVALWLSLNIYHNITSSTITKDVSVQIVPLKPTFNESIINNLRKRQAVTVDLSAQITTQSAAPRSSAIIPIQTVPATPSVTVTPPSTTPLESSGSGQILNQL